MQPVEGVDELFLCLSSLSHVFHCGFTLKGSTFLCPPTISDLLKPYELDGSQGLSAGAL